MRRRLWLGGGLLALVACGGGTVSEPSKPARAPAATPAMTETPAPAPEPEPPAAAPAPTVAEPPPAAKAPPPPTDEQGETPIEMVKTLEGAPDMLYEVFASGTPSELGVLAGDKPIRYRLTRDGKRGRWKTLQTSDPDKLDEFFDADNEDGDGYAVASATIHTEEKEYVLKAKKKFVRWEASTGHFGADFYFAKAKGVYRLTKIDAWEQAPQ